jgi:23S rRNA (pseudouridine1915-N3)-methyltransferase
MPSENFTGYAIEVNNNGKFDVAYLSPFKEPLDKIPRGNVVMNPAYQAGSNVYVCTYSDPVSRMQSKQHVATKGADKDKRINRYEKILDLIDNVDDYRSKWLRDIKTFATMVEKYNTAINDYIQRTKRSITFDMEVIPELKNTKSLSMEVQKEKEGELILKALQPGDVVVLLDEHGKEMRSLEFAEYMKRKMNTVNKRLVFIIGGPYGFSEKVYQAAHEKISMSKMTFSHQMIRLIFVEQIYRAMTILNGGPYHHE